MKSQIVLWSVLLALSTGCAALGKVMDNVTNPANVPAIAASAGTIAEKSTEGTGFDLTAAGVGGAITAGLGLIGAIWNLYRKVKSAKSDLWAAVKAGSGKPA